MANIVDIKGVGPASAKAIAAGGFDTVEKIAAATPTALATVPGIGEARAAALIEAAKALAGAGSHPEPAAAGSSAAGDEEKPAKVKKESGKKAKKSGKKKSENKKKKKKKKKK